MAQLHVDRSVGVEYRELSVQNNTTTVLEDGSALATGTAAVEERLGSEVLLEPSPSALNCSFPSQQK